MPPSDEELLQQELNYDEDRERYSHRHKLFFIPRTPPGQRFILVLMTLLWLPMMLLTGKAWGQATDLSAVAFLVVVGLELLVAGIIARTVWVSIGSTARTILRPLIRHWYLTLPLMCLVTARVAAPFLAAQATDEARAHGATEEEIRAGVLGATSGTGWRILTNAQHGYLVASREEAGRACEQASGRLPESSEARDLVPLLRVPRDMRFWLGTPVAGANNAQAFIFTRRHSTDPPTMSLYGGDPKKATVLCVVGKAALTPPPAAPASASALTTAPTSPPPAPLPSPVPVAAEKCDPPPEAGDLARSLAGVEQGRVAQALEKLRCGEATSLAGFATAGLTWSKCDDRYGLPLDGVLRCRANAAVLEAALASEATKRQPELVAALATAPRDPTTRTGLVYALSLTPAALPSDHAELTVLQGSDLDRSRVAERAAWGFAKRNVAAAKALARKLGPVADDGSLRTAHALAAGAGATEACRELGRVGVEAPQLGLARAALSDLPAACAREAAKAAQAALAKLPAEQRTFRGECLAALGAAAGPAVSALPADDRLGNLWTELVRREQARRFGVADASLLEKAARSAPVLLSPRACTAADFGLPKAQKLPFEAEFCYAAKEPDALKVEAPGYRPP